MSDIHINHPINLAPTGAETWTTPEFVEAFEVYGFGFGQVEVIRKSDRQPGTLEFNGMPRIYHSFKPT